MVLATAFSRMDPMTLPEPVKDPGQDSLALCRHFELLGVSAALKPLHDQVNFIHCTICGLFFYVKSEGVHLTVTRIEPAS
jgi:hypothetical protein